MLLPPHQPSGARVLCVCFCPASGGRVAGSPHGPWPGCHRAQGHLVIASHRSDGRGANWDCPSDCPHGRGASLPSASCNPAVWHCSSPTSGDGGGSLGLRASACRCLPGQPSRHRGRRGRRRGFRPRGDHGRPPQKFQDCQTPAKEKGTEAVGQDVAAGPRAAACCRCHRQRRGMCCVCVLVAGAGRRGLMLSPALVWGRSPRSKSSTSATTYWLPWMPAPLLSSPGSLAGLRRPRP